jgi:hypothetical protein
MRAVLIALITVLVCAVESSSMDKVPKVPYPQMVQGMRDAFDCGVVVEKYLHGSLKGNDDAYHQLRQEHNCDYVESVVNSPSEKH